MLLLFQEYYIILKVLPTDWQVNLKSDQEDVHWNSHTRNAKDAPRRIFTFYWLKGLFYLISSRIFKNLKIKGNSDLTSAWVIILSSI